MLYYKQSCKELKRRLKAEVGPGGHSTFCFPTFTPASVSPPLASPPLAPPPLAPSSWGCSSPLLPHPRGPPPSHLSVLSVLLDPSFEFS